MQKIIMLLLALFLAIPLISHAEKITLEWDTPTGETPPEGYRIYQRTAVEGDQYDYVLPEITTLYPDGNIPYGVNSVVLDVPGTAGSVLKYLWVARAYRGENQSIDSNEVSYKVVNVPAVSPAALAAEYDPEAMTISLAWDQPQDDHPIEKWIVYYRIDSNFVELGSVDSGQELTLSAPFDVIADGDMATVTFSVVAFRRSGVFSANSPEISLEIDRRSTEVDPIENLRININIPLV